MRPINLLLLLATVWLIPAEADAIDLRLVSVVARDGEHVDVTYEIVDGPLPAGVPLEIVRWSDDQGAPGQSPQHEVIQHAVIQTATIEHTSTGTHQQTVTIEGRGLSLRPELSVVAAVADRPTELLPDGVVKEADESNNSSSFRKWSVGVIIHGVTFGDEPPAWVSAMGQALEDKGYDAIVEADWAKLSKELTAGNPRLYAPMLHKQLLGAVAALPPAASDSVDIHWIAYSRGAAVLSECLQRWSDDLELPASISRGWCKVTLLDPHPCINRAPALASMNPWSPLGPIAAAYFWWFQEVASDAALFFPAEFLDEVEHYYQQTPWHRLSWRRNAFDYFLNLWGEPTVPGILADQTFDLTACEQGHTGIPDYYIDTVLLPGRLSAGEDTLSDSPEKRRDCWRRLKSAVINQGARLADVKTSAVALLHRSQVAAATAWQRTKVFTAETYQQSTNCAAAAWQETKTCTSAVLEKTKTTAVAVWKTSVATTAVVVENGRHWTSKITSLRLPSLRDSLYGRTR